MSRRLRPFTAISCKNVTYDYASLKNPNYLLKHTAYAALMNKTAVCQGYAALRLEYCEDWLPLLQYGCHLGSHLYAGQLGQAVLPEVQRRFPAAHPGRGLCRQRLCRCLSQ